MLTVERCEARIHEFRTDDWWAGTDTRAAVNGYEFLKLLVTLGQHA